MEEKILLIILLFNLFREIMLIIYIDWVCDLDGGVLVDILGRMFYIM